MTDYVLDYATVDFKFPSKNLSGVPTSIVGGVFSVYVGNSTTQVTAGLTYTSDFDSVTGLNHIRIDLSADAAYVAGTDYQVVCTAGTVDSISVVGEVVKEFTIENTATFARLGVPAGASVSADIAALNNISVSDVLTTQMTEAYAADGVAPTLAECLFIIHQNLQDFGIVGTTQTVKKLDGTTTAATYTFDSATEPTSKARAT